VDVLRALIKDPDGLSKQVEQLKAREAAAVGAEAKAQEAAEKADKALASHDRAVKRDEKKLEQRAAELDGRDEANANTAAALAADRVTLDEKLSAAEDWSNRLADLEKAMTADRERVALAEADLGKREEKVANDKASLAKREKALEEKIRVVNERAQAVVQAL
jgi:hypothetical protein